MNQIFDEKVEEFLETEKKKIMEQRIKEGEHHEVFNPKEKSINIRKCVGLLVITF